MKKIMIIFGTRPEAIKLAPLIRRAKIYGSKLRTTVCVTAQHRRMLDQVLNLFDITPDYDLNIMIPNQDIFDINVRALRGLKRVMKKEMPDIVIVQGDTTTSFVASLAAFYLQIPIAHVEAGLRTYNKYNPFPEETNRKLIGILADYHFAPTEWARDNLLKENISAERIWVTGNTAIDALITIVNRQQSKFMQRKFNRYFKENWNLPLPPHGMNGANNNTGNKKLILVTGHRRENFGESFRNICLALRKIAENNNNVVVVYPVHFNPNVQHPVFTILGSKHGNPRGRANGKDYKNIFLIDPLDYELFVYLMTKSYLILTDSGGIQEEAPSLGKPVLVMRNTTERPEGVEAGLVKLVGTNKEKIVEETQRLLEDFKYYKKMSRVTNPYGDGKAAKRILNILINN